MPGLPSDSDGSLIPFSPGLDPPAVYPINHGLRPPLFRIHISWSRGSLLHVTCLRPPPPPPEEEEIVYHSPAEEIGGKVVEVKLGTAPGESEIGEERKRQLAYESVRHFALIQNKKVNFLAMSGMQLATPIRNEWWQNVLEYSKNISSLLGNPKSARSSLIEDPKTLLQVGEEPTSIKAAWELMEIFYVDQQLLSWLPERLVDWLADYDSLLTKTETTVHSKLASLEKKLTTLQVIEDDSDYWEGLAAALAVGWLDTVGKLLRLHGSYQLDQMDSRETENGLVEAVSLLVLQMPRMRPDLPSGRPGLCCKTKPDYIKALEKWRDSVSKLEASAFWVECSHHKTRGGLRNLLQIMMGNIKNITFATCHWIELLVSHFIFIRPFATGLEGMYNLAEKCMQLKSSRNNGLTSLLLSILSENPEVVLADCLKTFGPWMVAHALELLSANSEYTDALLNEERANLGRISISELYLLTYAQILSSHPLTWQIAPGYLSSCTNQGLVFLEVLLLRQPIQNYRSVLKVLEVCRLNYLETISTSIMKIAGMYQWKHGHKGPGVYWFQQANDKFRLGRIAHHLFDNIGKSLSDDCFKQWEGLMELLGLDTDTAGGLDFLYKYRDFKRSLKNVLDGTAVGVARETMQTLVQLMKSRSTPQHFWLPLLHDSVKLLNWKGGPLLSVAETNLLLSKLQDLSMAKLRPDFRESTLPSHALNSIRLALAKNLGRAILEEC